MARHSRIKNEHGIFLIQQAGGGHRRLFESDADRLRFLTILKQAQEKFRFRLRAFCLSDDNGYRLLMDVNGGDISKIMKSINISYAMYAKCDGQLFRDRYRSTLLETPEQLAEAEGCVRENISANSRWNSYCSQSGGALPGEFVTLVNPPPADDDLDTCPACITTVPDALERLRCISRDDGRGIPEILKDKDCRNNLIRIFRQHSTLSLKELGQVFGGLSESSVSKILKP